jgi:hypothetical protein
MKLMQVIRWLLPAALLCATTAVDAAATLPAPFTDLVQVRSPQLGAVYLLPGTDFREYSKVVIDQVEVSFRKGWVKSQDGMDGGARVTQSDAEQIAQQARTGFQEILVAAFKDKGYPVVTTAAADVLRISPAVVNLSINAPMPASSMPGVVSFTVDAGQAELVLVARDSTTGAVLGLALDRREAQQAGLATSVGNRAAFENLFKNWAYICVKGLDKLKAASPIKKGR